MATRPDRTEAGAYYFTYIDQVPEGDIGELLRTSCLTYSASRAASPSRSRSVATRQASGASGM